MVLLLALVLVFEVSFELYPDVPKIKYDDIAQMNLYLSYYKKNIMQEDDNPPVGILMCTQAGKELVEYAKEGIDENLFVKKYKLALPKESELTKWLKKEVKDFGGK